MCFNKSTLYVTIITICGICSYPIFVANGFSHKEMPIPCGKPVTNQHSEHAKSIVQQCLKMHPLKDPNDGMSIEESQHILDENQSNCALKCINEYLNVTTEDGLIDVSKVQIMFLEGRNVTSPYVLKLISLMNECEHKAGEEVKAEGGFEESSCKYHTLFMHCYSDAYIASGQEINKEHLFTRVNGADTNPDFYACRVEFKDKVEKIKAITDCAAKQNYKLPTDNSSAAVQEEINRLIANDFDDSCFSKCWYESANLIKDGKINVNEFGSYYKNSNISEPLLKEYTKLFVDCVKETEPKFKDAKEIPCKMYAMVDVCCFKTFEDNKKRLEEICNK